MVGIFLKSLSVFLFILLTNRGQIFFSRYVLEDHRVAPGQPPEKLRDSHACFLSFLSLIFQYKSSNVASVQLLFSQSFNKIYTQLKFKPF